jgi:hypothetical protein
LRRVMSRGTGRGRRTLRLVWLATAAVVASSLAISPLPGADAQAANAHILAYGPGPCGPPPSPPPVCWYPADFHINSSDQVTWAMGSGNHGLEQLSTGSAWPSSCPKDKKYPTCSFSKPGVYRFQCSVHHEKMTGSVTVDFVPPGLQQPQAPPGSTAAAGPPGARGSSNPAQALLPSASPSADPAVGDSTSNNPTSSGGGGMPALVILEVVAILTLGGALAYFVATRKAA